MSADANSTDHGPLDSQPPNRARTAIGRTLSSDTTREAVIVPGLALFTALLFGAVIIVISDVDNIRRLDNDFLGAIGDSLSNVGTAYWALLRGSLGSVRAVSETLTSATPLIITGLALGLGFRAGMFNIGAQGQMVIGGLLATLVGFGLSMPAVIHIPLALTAGAFGGAIWGYIPGYLKARTGAHEVITTIMLNSIAMLVLQYVLLRDWVRPEGRNTPLSKPIEDSAHLPRLLGFLDRTDLRVHFGLLLALVLVYAVWWLLFRSTLGFEFRALGHNPTSSRFSGMNVTRLTTLVFALSGALAGVAAASQIQGLEPHRATTGFAGAIGFDAISIALLGRMHPYGILAAAVLFGGLRAGGQEMQAVTDVPVDMILIVQSLIVIFIAAPALIRTIYRVRTGEGQHLAGGSI